MHLETWQWLIAAGGALFIGFSKTGLPGAGIVVVPLLARAFGGLPSVGIMLPMLIFGDCFAVFWYRRHAQWDRLVGLLPWIVVGMGLAFAALWQVQKVSSGKDVLGVIIGITVLVMLAVHLLRGRLGDRLTPTSSVGVAFTGSTAGFATTVANAAGPVMSIYMAAQKLRKEQFMGTIAWYFFTINLSKVPLYVILTKIHPKNPILTAHSFLFTLAVSPAIIVGVFLGKWLLPRISQSAFDGAVLILAAVYAVKLIIG